jgi:hypothetical protein
VLETTHLELSKFCIRCAIERLDDKKCLLHPSNSIVSLAFFWCRIAALVARSQNRFTDVKQFSGEHLALKMFNMRSLCRLKRTYVMIGQEGKPPIILY